MPQYLRVTQCHCVAVGRQNKQEKWANGTYSNFHVALPRAALLKLRQKAILCPVLRYRLLGSLILKFTHDHTSVGNFLSGSEIAYAILVEQVMRLWVEIDPHWWTQHKD